MVSGLYPSPDVPKIHIFTHRQEQFFPTVTNQQVDSVDFQADLAMDEIRKPCDPQHRQNSIKLSFFSSPVQQVIRLFKCHLIPHTRATFLVSNPPFLSVK